MTGKTERTALVTGASRGIGRGIAEALAQNGWNVAVGYHTNETAANEVVDYVEKNGNRAVAVKGDVGSAEDRLQMVDVTTAVLGSISLLVNNAGIAPTERKDILDESEESFDKIITANLKGPYFLTQLVANQMIAATKSGSIDGGQVIFITSISSYTASVNRGDYCVSKAGLGMAAKLWAARLAEFGISVFEVQPGIIETDMTGGAKEKYDRLIHTEGLLPIARWGTPADVGMTVAAIAERRLPYSTGAVIPVDGGFHLKTL